MCVCVCVAGWTLELLVGIYWQRVKIFNVESSCTYWLLNIPPALGLKNVFALKG